MAPGIWIPSAEFIGTTNIAWLMRQAGRGFLSGRCTPGRSIDREAYWAAAIERLGISFRTPFRQVADLSPGWRRRDGCLGARLNIVESCFAAPADSPAIIHQAEGGAAPDDERRRACRADGPRGGQSSPPGLHARHAPWRS